MGRNRVVSPDFFVIQTIGATKYRMQNSMADRDADPDFLFAEWFQ